VANDGVNKYRKYENFICTPKSHLADYGSLMFVKIIPSPHPSGKPSINIVTHPHTYKKIIQLFSLPFHLVF
jgi:hypothetical protein